jgi:hypothetical protein
MNLGNKIALLQHTFPHLEYDCVWPFHIFFHVPYISRMILNSQRHLYIRFVGSSEHWTLIPKRSLRFKIPNNFHCYIIF